MHDEPATPAITEWNAAGRRYVAELNRLIADSHEGRDTPENWPNDPRDVDTAREILSLVEAEYRSGKSLATHPLADRAHEPFGDMLNDVCQHLQCVCILGPDEFLVRLGTAYKPGPALHIKGERVVERSDILAAAMTRRHDLLLLVKPEGFRVSSGLDDAPVATFAWPEHVAPQALDVVQISEDGRTIAFVEREERVWLGQADGAGMTWTCVYPNATFLAEHNADEEDEDGEYRWSDSMLHCGLAPDGKFIAYGSQCYGHFIDRIDGIGVTRRWAEIGYRSEYPHNACFSDDSAFAALNSCHFYHGATVGVRLDQVEGAQTAAYEPDERTTLLDDRLRVYAATWLPLGPEKDGFALAGVSYLNIVSTEGGMRSTTCFGSSASSIDYCPKTGWLAVASYSGFLHLFEPARAAEDGTVIGYRPIHERYRWVLWRDRAPFRW